MHTVYRMIISLTVVGRGAAFATLVCVSCVCQLQGAVCWHRAMAAFAAMHKHHDAVQVMVQQHAVGMGICCEATLLRA